MNLPNKLSVTRALLIPVLVVLMYFDNRVCSILAAAVFGAAAYTDYLDGHIARQRGIVTDFGKFIDPVADKLLNLSAMIMLTRSGLLPHWMMIVILARELCVDGLRMVAVGQGKVIAAGWLGKVKTTSQIVLVLWLLLTRLPVSRNLFSALIAVWVVAITLWSGVDYFVRNRDCVKNVK
ncbi:MAG: CDP-diacylglycerol--glycerol-3-phosphate 3-phosphatidyltransferase [Christensenellaceae bacterium]|nr:CDP-diacylglycerol--glycerol-3-phosphate 3-phosphatidyltransferase [Christensenellaceae bacterium]